MFQRLSGIFIFVVACGPATPASETPATPGKDSPQAASGSQVPAPACTELDFDGCKAACERGTAHGCTLAAEAVSDDRRGLPAQKAQVADLLKKACDGGDPEGCRDLGHRYREGTGGPKDAAESDRLYKKALLSFKGGCEKGRAEGCDLLGHMTGQGWGTARDEAEEKRLRQQAIELYAKACSPSDPASCAVAAEDYQSGFWVPKDVPGADKLLHIGCDAKDAQSCFLLGLDSLFGTGGATQDPSVSLPLLHKACDAGSLKACSTLGESMVKGENGAPQDPAGALALLERSCNGPGEILVAPACHEAAELRVGRGESPTSEKVVALEKRACLLGFKNGCDALK